MRKISVVIPVYQAEKYIGATIGNLKRQTIDNFEAILVDNGSTDNSLAVARHAMGDDERFQLLNESVKGPSAARNKGITVARGEWILFLDADDTFADDMLETMLRAAANRDGCDNRVGDDGVVMVVSGYQTWQNGHMLYASPMVSEEYDPKGMAKRLFQVEHYQGFIWNKLLRKSVIDRYRLRFQEDIFYNEDRLFVLEFLLKCYEADKENLLLHSDMHSVIRMITAQPYYYQLHEISAMSSARKGGMVADREATEIVAFERMLSEIEEILGKDNEVYSSAKKDMIYSELRMFRKMVGRRRSFQYRNHMLRRFARKAEAQDVFFLEGKDKILWNVFIRYGRTGSVYTRNPDFFR